MNGDASLVYRALRSGDGSDATVIATSDVTPNGMFAFNGYLWFGPYRISTSTGLRELVTAIDTSYAVTTGADVFARQMLDPNGSYWRFGTLDQSDTFHTIFDSMWQPYVPLRLAFDGGEMFWTGTTTILYRAHLTDMAFAPDPRFLGGFGPFAVTSDAILFNFTRVGYDSIPR